MKLLVGVGLVAVGFLLGMVVTGMWWPPNPPIVQFCAPSEPSVILGSYTVMYESKPNNQRFGVAQKRNALMNQAADELLECAKRMGAESQEIREENDLFPKLSDREFVRLVYLTMLRREPDPAGWQSWTNWLDRGATRGWVVWQQMNSDEFKDRWEKRSMTVINSTFEGEPKQ